MLLLITAVLFYTLIFICFKLIDKYKIGNFESILWNYFIASLTGFLVFGVDLNALFSAPWLPIAFIIGFIFFIVFHLFALCTQKISITMTAMASKMSVVIPVLVSIIVFQELLGTIKIIGIVLTLISLFFILMPDKSNPINKKYLFIPILIFILTGISDSLFKIAQSTYHINDGIGSAQFVSTIFGVSFVVSLISLPFFRVNIKEIIRPKNIIGGTILGLVNFFAVFFFTYSMINYNGSHFFPIFNSGVVASSAIFGFVLFKEKISKINIFGLILALAAIILMNL